MRWRGFWLLALLTLLGGWATAISQSDILPPSKIRPGMKGYGLSVFRGTEIERFPVTVLGVLERADFDFDAILIRIDGGTVVRRKSGVIAGMSGSPIFINGKLVGAIAFGWGFPKEPICGVTPITAMLACTDPQRFPSPRLTSGVLRPKGSPIVVHGRSVHRVWLATNLREAEKLRRTLRPDEGLLVPVATPLLVRGVPRSLLPLVQRLLEPYNFVVLEGAGGSSNLPVKDAPIRPGSALGVQLVGGDVNFTAIGTVTWVEGERFWAFGHPMMSLGKVELPVTSAYILDIFPAYDFSFKLGVDLKERGRLTQDRTFAVAGDLGKVAERVPMQVQMVNYAQRLQRAYQLKLVQHRELLPLGAYLSLLGALFTNVSPTEEGCTYTRLQVEARGFEPIVRENWYPNEGGGMFGGLLFIILGGARTSPLAELADILEATTNNRFGEVKFTHLSAELAFYPQRRTAWIDRVTARKTRVKPGEKVPVSLRLKGWGGFERTMTVELEVPANARPGRMRFLVGGGLMGEMVRQQSGYRRPRPRSLSDLWQQLQDVYANNEVLIATNPLTSGVEISGKRWESLPAATMEALMNMGSSDIVPIRDYREKRFAFDRILTGLASITLTVETDEREKETPARPPMMEPGPPPPSGPTGGEPSPSNPGSEGEEEVAQWLNRWQTRLSLIPLARQWQDPIERAWWEIQRARWKWQEEESLPDWWRTIRALQREEKMDKEQPPQPPDWEEVRRLSPEAAEQKGQPPSQPPSQPTPTGQRTQPLARQPKVWVLEKGDDWLKGKLDGTIVATDGTVTLGYHARTLFDPNETIGAFCLLPASDGAVIVGTIGPARVLRVDGQGKRTVLAEVPEEAVVTALAWADDGALWFATAPKGLVFRLPKDADKPQRLAQLSATVWAIAFAKDGTAVLATGPEGKVWSLTADKPEPRLLLSLPERHAIALAKAPDGSLYIGTNPRGKVYRLSPDGSVTPIFEAPQNPVQALAVDSKGNLFVGTSGSAIVYLVQPDGRWREVRRFNPERHIMAVFPDGDGILVATGSPGKLYRLTADGVATWLYDSEQSHLLSVACHQQAFYTIPSGSGEVVVLERNREGIYQSPILDAQQIARWGVLRFHADIPEGAQLIIQSRSGNTAYPDETWSDWTPGFVASGQVVQSPTARYLQLRLILRASKDGKAPVVRRVSLVYFPKNQPPKVTVQEPSNGAIVSGKVTIRWRGEDPDRDRLTYEVFLSRDGGRTWERLSEGATPTPSKPAEPAKNEPAKTEPVKGDEPQQPEKPQPSLQPSPPSPSAPSSAATTASSQTWDTTKLPDGTYWLKIVASDRLANPDDPQTAEQIVGPILVDNTPPMISVAGVKRDGHRLLVPCYDNTFVASAEYRAEGGEWMAATCEDGIFDEPYELVIVDLSKLPANAKAIEVRVRDGAGNERTEKIPLTN